jgi:hypothetical protein
VIAHNPHHRLFPQRPGQGHAKPVKAIGPRGEVCGVFSHADQAAAALGVWRNAIVSALRKGNRAAGYHWRYVGVPDECQPPPNTRLRSSCQRRPIPERFWPREEPPAPRTIVSKGRNLEYSPRRPETVVERTPAEWERGRFERARKLNPLLTWEHWQEIIARQPMGPRPQKERRLQAVPDAPTGVTL